MPTELSVMRPAAMFPAAMPLAAMPPTAKPSATKPSATKPSVQLHSLGEATVRLRRNWLWMVLFGAALALVGLLALSAVELATVATLLMVGVMMLLGGTAEVAMGVRARDWSHCVLWIASGFLYVAAGIFAIIDPSLASLVLTLMLGAGLIAAGLVRVVHAMRLPATPQRAPLIVSGTLSALLGLIIALRWPNNLFVLGLLLATDLIIHGVGWIVFGYWLRNAHR